MSCNGFTTQSGADGLFFKHRVFMIQDGFTPQSDLDGLFSSHRVVVGFDGFAPRSGADGLFPKCVFIVICRNCVADNFKVVYSPADTRPLTKFLSFHLWQYRERNA